MKPGKPIASSSLRMPSVVPMPVSDHGKIDFTTTPSIPCTRDHVIAAIRSSRFVLFDKSISNDHRKLGSTVEKDVLKAEAQDWLDGDGYDRALAVVNGSGEYIR